MDTMRSSRRELLIAAGPVVLAGVIGVPRPSVATLTVANDRPYWRYCAKCQVMFYTDAEKGACAAGATHQPMGYQFFLPFDGAETPTAQANWRCCRNCQELFFNGFREKGRCPAGGVHAADHDFKYVLPHSVHEAARTQRNWRYCARCQAMFYDGFPTKGHCAAKGVHAAAGYNFVLPHSRR